MSLLAAEKSCLLLVDVQEKLTPALFQHEQLVQNCRWMVQVANKMQIPMLVSEQYPQGLGPTIPELKELFTPDQVASKLHFSCAADAGCLAKINALKREQIVIVGIETHVCVLQTAIELQEMGKQVFLVADAVSSRSERDKELALKRMRQAGIQIVSKEMVLFEWLRKSGSDLFKTMSKEFLR